MLQGWWHLRPQSRCWHQVSAVGHRRRFRQPTGANMLRVAGCQRVETSCQRVSTDRNHGNEHKIGPKHMVRMMLYFPTTTTPPPLRCYDRIVKPKQNPIGILNKAWYKVSALVFKHGIGGLIARSVSAEIATSVSAGTVAVLISAKQAIKWYGADIALSSKRSSTLRTKVSSVSSKQSIDETYDLCVALTQLGTTAAKHTFCMSITEEDTVDMTVREVFLSTLNCLAFLAPVHYEQRELRLNLRIISWWNGFGIVLG